MADDSWQYVLVKHEDVIAIDGDYEMLNIDTSCWHVGITGAEDAHRKTHYERVQLVDVDCSKPQFLEDVAITLARDESWV